MGAELWGNFIQYHKNFQNMSDNVLNSKFIANNFDKFKLEFIYYLLKSIPPARYKSI